MDGKAPDNYVSELLKQLKELKKKKAHKEKKLMKLKSCTPNKTNKIKIVGDKCSSSHSKLDFEVIEDEDDSFSNNVNNGDICNNIVKEQKLCEITKSVDSKCDISNECIKITSFSSVKSSKGLDVQNHKNDSTHSNYVVKACTRLEEVETSINTRNMSPNFKDLALKNLNEVENKLMLNLKDSQYDSNESNKSTLISNESIYKSKSSCKNTLNSNVDNSESKILYYIDPLNSNETKKSSNKNKSPDVLDESFNYNMGDFMCGFDGIEDEIVINKGLSNTISKKEIGVEFISANLKISPPFSLSQSYNGTQKLNSSLFNFPKFSTPTDIDNHAGNTKDEKACSVVFSNSSVTNENCTFKTDNVPDVQKGVIEDTRNDKFDSLQLNTFLKKGLSSILDAHYGSPTKESVSTQNKDEKISSVRKHYHVLSTNKSISKETNSCSNPVGINLKQKFGTFENVDQPVKLDNSLKFVSYPEKSIKQNIDVPSKFEPDFKNSKTIDEYDFDGSMLFSDPFTDSQDTASESVCPFATSKSCNKIPSQVTKTIDELIAEVCENFSHQNNVLKNVHGNEADNNIEFETEILIVPETEGLDHCSYSKFSEDFLETSTLSQSFPHFKDNENILNMSSQSKLESPVINNIVSALKLSQVHPVNKHETETKFNQKDYDSRDDLLCTPKRRKTGDGKFSDTLFPNDTLVMNTSCTQDLETLRQVPYMSGDNVEEESIVENSAANKSNLSFICSLHGSEGESVIDAEMTLFNGVKYAFLQHKTQIHVWREDKSKWIKIFYHTIENMYSLEKICVSRNADCLVVAMLLCNNKKFCLQFLLFQKDNTLTNLMENTHWLEGLSSDPVLMCGLEDLMFATAQNKEVSLHAFVGLKKNPRLVTIVLGSTDSALYSLCKVEKLPNGLIGINNSMFYIWHVLEARLVTAVSLYPRDYLPIKTCFWATIEKGIIFILTTCEGTEEFKVCQLLAANLATGFCQSTMTYSTLPSQNRTKILKILKAEYMEPFLVIAHSNGAFLWSVTEEFCCAALSCESRVTTVTISKDIKSWGLIAVGTNTGCIQCYSLN